MVNRANRILPYHRFSHSLGAPLTRVQGTRVFAAPENHHGANHQHFTVLIETVLEFEGLDHEIADLQEGRPIELQGEYIESGDAYPTEDNRDPVLPVLHFTHHPVGYVLYEGVHYS
ncbi:hypothetical protein PY650_28270 [Rhizobium calliandrae]|uniref:Cupin domain-containing protein n=1 Tax=Rhizobium calliandrae TaxID=1312182 RepID=A0ABT7KN75_9HYPH|nr:hypothetical protein [Rhizobium calliandrae]MDL2409460.1 hypothetical protein [Rhizobium calliandrae]